ncbi:hypothetical protein JZO66_02935 [Enterococcus sp. DIV0242_7C1]|uniref:Uncharacterized protein n=1 Tax=Candidatus Enterococcus dunnyi TaxID=1834192 RepID=A0AAQ3W1N4_9ENTE|nr:hypothetical protein [Enterococcus sp. DIV0242_7C1]MBO0469487.1 hypothetical protein [Enterococcus sp. DIV0242_7C1]
MGSEVLKQVKVLFIMIGSCICAYKFPLATIFLNITDQKVLASLDIGFYNFVFSVIFALVFNFVSNHLLHIDVNISYPNQETNKIVFSESDLEKSMDIEMKIVAKGKVRKTYKSITLVCPESYMIQLHENSSRKFISIDSGGSNYELDINKMISRYKKDVSTVKTIKLSLVLEEYHKGDKDYLVLEKPIWLGFVSIKKNKLELKQN